MFSDKDILKDEHVTRFVNNRNLRPKSIKVYKNTIKNYCNFTGLSPSQLLKKADKEQDMRIKTRQKN